MSDREEYKKLVKELFGDMSSDESDHEEPPPARRGRKRKAEVPFDDRLLLMTSPSQLHTNQVLTCQGPETGPSIGAVKCGLCLKKLSVVAWREHLNDHYGIGWIDDSQPSVDVTDREHVLKVIRAYLSRYPLTRLKCRMCPRSFRVAKTLIDHIEQCARRGEPQPTP